MIGRALETLTKFATVRMWALIGSGMAMTIVAMLYAAVIAFGGWPVTRAEQQIDYLGWGMLVALTLVGLVFIALTESKFKLSAGKVNVEADSDSHDAAPSPPTVVTTTTE